jgi:hypothetical protein
MKAAIVYAALVVTRVGVLKELNAEMENLKEEIRELKKKLH